ncbi:hypothetical protein OS242_10635 [Tumebacillus sp. DT12]|uniref:Uncharacterized protein n=1 Tax=Tumebacillus lacus TaxID=2995335 RepID=A0ABT3X0J5_9BACL|nr:hypothetical protein [Tumebacillus lacus]MCX7570419.1 hypothetical protein [Tumebacillus lacus]
MAMQEGNIKLLEEVAEMRTMVNMTYNTVTEMKRDLSNNYMPRQEIESRFERGGERTGRLESRVKDLEAAPHKHLSTVISLISVGVAIFAVATR